MYAVLETGGKQYRVQEGDIVFVEKLGIEAGQKVTFEKVLLVEKEGVLNIGEPTIDGAFIEAKVLKNDKAKKIIVYKFKPKKGYRKKQGHRQPYTQVQIEKISV